MVTVGGPQRGGSALPRPRVALPWLGEISPRGSVLALLLPDRTGVRTDVHPGRGGRAGSRQEEGQARLQLEASLC